MSPTMCVFGGLAVILLLTAQRHTAMSQEMMSSMTAYRNYSMLGFPPLTPGFQDVAQRLMTKCLRMGYPPPRMMEINQTSFAGEAGDDMPQNPFFLFPSLLSSLPSLPRPHPPLVPPNDTMAPPTGEMDMNETIAYRLMNCSDLLHVLELIKNSTDDSLCFLRAFVAPMAWDVLVTNGTDLALADFTVLLWGVEPLLQHAPPPLLTLPPRLSPQQLKDMMELLSRVFDFLSQDQRLQVLHWVKLQVSQKPQVGWLKADVMETMGRYLFLLPSSQLDAVPEGELCAFFWSPRYACPFCRAGRAPAPLGRSLLRKVTGHCFRDEQSFLGRLGSLACFYGNTSSLNMTLSKTLLPQLRMCRNSDGIKLRKQLVMRVISEESGSLLWLLGLGASTVSALSQSQLAQLPAPALWDALPGLGRGEWQPVQARTLARILLQGRESVSGEELLRLGSIARGVRSAMLRKVGPWGILGRDELTALSQELSALQRAALLEGLLGNVSVSELVNSVSGPLLSSLSLSALEQAGLRSINQLEGREWTRAQSAFLVREILSQRLRPQDIRKLGWAVQGVTCKMIDSTNQPEVLPLVEALLQSRSWLSRQQVRCAAEKLFESLEKKREDYFLNITEQELRVIPTPVLLYLRTQFIAHLPDSVCILFLEMMSQADLTLLPLGSGVRLALIESALACMKKNLSSLTPDDITSLGGLILELEPWKMSLLSPAALNASLLALTKSSQMHRHHQVPIFNYLTQVYGEPSSWSLDMMTSLGPLLLWVNGSAFKSLPYKPWLKGVLTDFLDSRHPTSFPPLPEEFNTQPDLSDLRWKHFSLVTTPASHTATNQQRRGRSHNGPTLLEVVELGQGNMNWSPAQLDTMSPETFRDGVSELGAVRGYSPQQLQSLRKKTIQVWGEVGSLSEEQVLQLGCIAQGLSPVELQKISSTSLDSLELLSGCDWEHQQSEAVLQGFLRRTNQTIGGLGLVEVVGLSQFMCGMSPQEVDQLNTDIFREAVGALGSVHCALDVTERLKDKALLIFGEPGNWTEAQVNILGNIIAGLNSSELQSLNPAVFSFIRQSAIPLILPERLAALSIEQLIALGPDNAAMVTDAQYSALGLLQQDAVYKAMDMQIYRLMIFPGPSGTSRPRITGNIVFWQALLLLLIYIQ